MVCVCVCALAIGVCVCVVNPPLISAGWLGEPQMFYSAEGRWRCLSRQAGGPGRCGEALSSLLLNRPPLKRHQISHKQPEKLLQTHLTVSSQIWELVLMFHGGVAERMAPICLKA